MKAGKPKNLKVNNRKLVLELFRKNEILTAAEISKAIDISKTTVMKILDFLSLSGLILIAGKGDSTGEGGKKPVLFKLNERFALAAGVHILPDRIDIVVSDLFSKPLYSGTVKLDDNESLERVTGLIALSLEKIIKKNKISKKSILGIGIAIPGIVDSTKGVVCLSPRFPSWGTQAEFVKLISEKTNNVIPVYIDNECRFKVYAEKKSGVAKDRKNIIAVEAGYGLVAGIMINNEIIRGVHNLAGEIGHMVIAPESQAVCVCGGSGCFEVMVSVERLIETAKALKSESPDSLIFKYNDNHELNIERIFIAAGAGDQLAIKLMEGIIKWFAIGLSNLIVMCDPEIIVLQGIYTKAGESFLNALKKRINELVLVKINKKVEIRCSQFEGKAAITGAVSYVVDETFYNYIF